MLMIGNNVIFDLQKIKLQNLYKKYYKKLFYQKGFLLPKSKVYIFVNNVQRISTMFRDIQRQ